VGNYIQPGTANPPAVEIQAGRPHVTTHAHAGNFVQPTAKAAPIEIQVGLPFSKSPNVATPQNYVQPDERPEAKEIQLGLPHASAPTDARNYQQPGQHLPSPLPDEALHGRMKLTPPSPPTPYVQPGTSAQPEMYDAGKTNAICPWDGSFARHTGSSAWPFRCDGFGHQFGLSMLGNFQGPTGDATFTGLPELGAGNQPANEL
jgi:hypothetical protein